MMAQYQAVKARYPGHLLLFRVGDFFETFGEDAAILSRDADVALTSRQMDGDGKRIPLAGVPYHTVEGYLARLIRKGHRVVICDQVEDPRTARGLVRREVTRIVTPGTAVEEGLLPGAANNFLVSWWEDPIQGAVAALVDVSTGETFLREAGAGEAGELAREVAALEPVEVLLPPQDGPVPRAAWKVLLPRARIEDAPPPLPVDDLPASWKIPAGPEGGIRARALGALAAYVRGAQPRLFLVVRPPELRPRGERMRLDVKSLRHLEITEPMGGAGTPSPTLLDVLGKGITPQGTRTIEAWIRAPLSDVGAIRGRLNAVERLVAGGMDLVEVSHLLQGVGDISRLTTRIVTRRAGPRDLRALGQSLAHLKELQSAAARLASEDPLLAQILGRIGDLSPLSQTILESLPEDPPPSLAPGGVLRPERFPELAALDARLRTAKEALRELEEREARATGIKNLRVGFNQVFGYFFEVSRPQLGKVPLDRWQRKQTLAGAERFVSEELLRWETEVRAAEEEAHGLETRLWEELLAQVDAQAAPLRETSLALGELDALLTFAQIARDRHWVKPQINEGTGLRIREGRHPILERVLGHDFVPNDTDLSPDGTRLLVLTGPNMAGKSTYMRQVGLLVVLAHAGSFVPARYAEMGRVSSLATRMGFTDEIGKGKSSFMVEMSEVAEILRDADPRSLILLDEVGRGTSTSDGLALAWAIVHHLHDRVRARTIVATHYHQLAALAESLPAARNAHLAVKEERGEVVFLRTLLPGATDKSYGIHVAELAGVPAPVLQEARRVQRELEAPGPSPGRGRTGNPPPRYTQAVLVEDPEVRRAREIAEELSRLDLDRLSPLEALQVLARLRRGEPAHPPEGS